MLRVVDWESRHRIGQLTVSHLRYELDDTVRVVEVLFEIVTMIDRSRDSGVILDELSHLSLKYKHIGPVKEASDAMLIAGFEPFMKVIIDYCTTGSTASDVFDEIFMKRIHAESPVEGLRSCPSNLKPFSSHIIRSGRNASLSRSLGHSPGDRIALNTIQVIEDEYTAANFFNECVSKTSTALYHAVDSRSPIEPAIRWFCEYLLITKSDWFSLFVAKSMSELEKPIKLVDRSYLNELLQILPNSPSCEMHAFQIEDMFGPGGDIRTLAEIQNEELESSSLPAIKALTLNPNIQFPLSLVFTESTLFKFQTVFRILSYSRIVSMKLSQVWLEFQSFKSIGDGCVLFSANILLKRMMHLVDNFLFHLNVDVVATNLRNLDLTGSPDIDKVRESIESVIESILAGCCISPACVRSVNKILGTCSLFASHMTKFAKMHASSGEEELIIRTSQDEQYIGLIAKFEDAFDGQVNSLLVQLKHHVSADRARAQALVAIIDYNDYYSDKIGL